VFGVVQLRSARAEVGDRSIEFGRQMMQLANATNRDLNKLTFNGQPMWLGSGIANDSTAAILDRYESYCSKNIAQPTESWRELANKADASVDKSFISTGIMRSGTKTGDEGSVICFTKGENSKGSVADAVRAFGETGQLGAFGNLRYAYAKKTESGRTLVLTAWTDDKFNLKDLVPKEGKDAGGADFPELPRPPASLRIFAAQVEGSPFGVNIYQSQDAPTEVAAFYDNEMIRRGWRGFDPKFEDKDVDRSFARLYEREGVVLTLVSGVRDGATVTALGLAGASAHDGLGAKNDVSQSQ